MKISNFFRKKKAEQNSITQLGSVYTTITDEQVNAVLAEEIKTFFPDQGCWWSGCFQRPSEVKYKNLPCHLRDNDWLSCLLKDVIEDRKGIHLSSRTIKNFIDKSEEFAKLRHAYELKIVEWQINWIKSGGKNWILPEGYDELALYFGEDVDKIIRGGVSRTLQAIGMNRYVIEEGLEKFAESWRPAAMRIGFKHIYEPCMFTLGRPDPASGEHKSNWLADREYQYYMLHKKSVDKYGIPTPAMLMTPAEHAKLLTVLTKQNIQRMKYLEDWRKGFLINSKRQKIYTEEDTLSK